MGSPGAFQVSEWQVALLLRPLVSPSELPRLGARGSQGLGLGLAWGFLAYRLAYGLA